MAGRVLWLLRHAKTVPDPPVGGTDHERPLTARGRRDAEALGHRLGAAGDRFGLASELPDVVLSSTARRTVETAERVVAGWAEPPEVRFLRVLYGADPGGVLDELALLEPTLRGAMVVGHNPTAASLAEGLLGDSDEAGRAEVERAGFATCALAVFAFTSAESWQDVALGRATLLGAFRPPY